MKNQDKYDIKNKTGLYNSDCNPVLPSEVFSSAAQNRPPQNAFNDLLKKVYFQSFHTLPVFANSLVSFEDTPEMIIGAPTIPSGETFPYYIPVSIVKKRVAGTPDAAITINYTIGSNDGHFTFIHLGDALGEGVTYLETLPNLIVIKSASSVEAVKHKAMSILLQHDTTPGLSATEKENVYTDDSGVQYLKYRLRFDATTKTIAGLVSDLQALMGADCDIEVVSEDAVTLGTLTLSATFMSDYLTNPDREYRFIPPRFRVDITDTGDLFPDMTAVGYEGSYIKRYHPFAFEYSDGTSNEPVFNNTGIYGFVTSKLDETGADFQTAYSDPIGSVSTSKLVLIPFDASSKFSMTTDIDAGNPYIFSGILNAVDVDYNFIPLFSVTKTDIKFSWGFSLNIDTYIDYFTSNPGATEVNFSMSSSEFPKPDKLSEEIFNYTDSSINNNLSTYISALLTNIGFNTSSSTIYSNSLEKLLYAMTNTNERLLQVNTALPEITTEYDFSIAPANLHHWGYHVYEYVSNDHFQSDFMTYDRSAIGGATVDVINGAIIPEGVVNIVEEHTAAGAKKSYTITDILTFAQYNQYINDLYNPGLSLSHVSNLPYVGIQQEISTGDPASTESYFYMHGYIAKTVEENTHQIFNAFTREMEGRLPGGRYEGYQTSGSYNMNTEFYDYIENAAGFHGYHFSPEHYLFNASSKSFVKQVKTMKYDRGVAAPYLAEESSLSSDDYYYIDSPRLYTPNPNGGLNEKWIKSIPITIGVNTIESADEVVDVNIGFDYNLNLKSHFVADYMDRYRTVGGVRITDQYTFAHECMGAVRDNSNAGFALPGGRSLSYDEVYFIPVLYFTTMLQEFDGAATTVVAVDAAPMFDSTQMILTTDNFYNAATPATSVVSLDTATKINPYYTRIIKDQYVISDVTPTSTIDSDQQFGFYNFHTFDAEEFVTHSSNVAIADMSSGTGILTYNQDQTNTGDNVGHDLFIRSTVGSEHIISLAGFKSHLTTTEHAALSSYSAPDTTKGYAVKTYRGYKNFNINFTITGMKAAMDSLINAHGSVILLKTPQIPLKNNNYDSANMGALRKGHDKNMTIYLNIGIIPIMLHSSTDWSQDYNDWYITMLCPADFRISQSMRNIQINTKYDKV